MSRIFSRGSWSNNGRFYGGFWQQVEQSYRGNILINDKPTIEVDYSGIHVAILSINKGETFNGYEFEENILSQLNKGQQTKALKLLVLTAIYASSKQQAYRAFRGSSDINLTDQELEKLLNMFLDLNSHLSDHLFSDMGVNLMYTESLIVEHVIKKFTYTDLPILSVNQSFIVQYDQILKLKEYMTEASKAVLGKPFNYERDLYDQVKVVQFEHIDQDFYDSLMTKPPKVLRSERYGRTYNKYRLWMERNKQGVKPHRIIDSLRKQTT